MAALEYAHVPGYAALILRRTFADLSLPGAIMDRSHAWFRPLEAQGVCSWDGGTKRWTFKGGGSITFGYLEHEADVYRYQGAEFQFVGFDELTQFSEPQYRYLMSRTRRPAEGALSQVPLRVAAASNPGGAGHEWVRQRFLTEGRQFVPAKLSDNPHLDQKSYRKQLEKLDPVTRAQLLEGDWNITPKGPMFDRAWFKFVDAPPPRPTAQWWRYWDLAGTKPKPGKDPDWTVGALLALRDGEWFICDIVRMRDTPGRVEQAIRATAAMDGFDVPITIEQEPGQSGVAQIEHYQRRVLVGYTVNGDKKTGNKIDMAKPLSAAAEAGHVYLVRAGWNGPFLDEASAFPIVGHDDQIDAVSGAQRRLADGWGANADIDAFGGRRVLTVVGDRDWGDDDSPTGRRF